MIIGYSSSISFLSQSFHPRNIEAVFFLNLKSIAMSTYWRILITRITILDIHMYQSNLCLEMTLTVIQIQFFSFAISFCRINRKIL